MQNVKDVFWTVFFSSICVFLIIFLLELFGCEVEKATLLRIESSAKQAAIEAVKKECK